MKAAGAGAGMKDQDAVEHWAQVDRLLDRVLALPPTDRAAFVEQQTTDDPRLRDEVLALLDELNTRGDLLDRPALSAVSHRAPAADLQAGHRIGAYRVLSLLGRGGMGEVYRAERADGQFDHQVALKLLRQDAVEHLGLFVSERRILARLEHPGIARLYDAGVGDDGRPYMVMELVEGVPVTDWCRQRKASLRERLALFAQVCDGVAYAHQNLVIHRDLKPGNILVTADGRAKLLDFGVAKLLSSTADENTRSTPLTMSYAAPEQLTHSAVSTATDIYALGVLLFELLTDRLPWAMGQIPIAVAIDKALHETAPAPSKAAMDSASPPVAARQLSGDLDAIVAKSLRKVPADRYATVAGLRADVRRHVQGEPVTAREGARLYVFGRFLRRYRWAVAGVMVLVATLAAGLAGTIWQARRAETQARTSDAVQKFMGDVFRANSSNQEDPVKARQTTARELLDLGAKNIDKTMADAPAAKLSVLRLMGQLYDDLALDDEAVRLRKQAVAVSRELNGEDSVETASTLVELAGSMHASNSVNQRQQTLDEASAILDRIKDVSSPTRAELFMKYSEHYTSLDSGKGLEYADKAVTLLEAKPPSVDLAEALSGRGFIQGNQGKSREAEASFRRAIEVSRAAEGFPNPSLPRFYAYLGQMQYSLQDIAGAESSARLALQTARAINGERHVDTLQTGMRLGRILFDTGRMREGMSLLDASRRLALDIRGPDDPFHTPQIMLDFGFAQARSGLIEQGLANMQLAVANRRANRPGTIYLATMLDQASFALIEMGRFDEAKADLDEADAIRMKSGAQAGTDPFRYNVENRIRMALAQGQPEAARMLLKDYYVDTDESQGMSLSLVSRSLLDADVDLASGQGASAIRLVEQVRNKIAKAGLTRYSVFQAMRSDLIEAQALLKAAKPAEAEPLLRRTLAMREQLLAPSSPRIAEAQIALAECDLAMGREEEAMRLETAARAIHAQHKELGEQYRGPLQQLERRTALTRATPDRMALGRH